MDQRLNDALAFANYRLTLQIQRQNILAQVETALLVSHQSAVFRASPELIAFVGLMTIRDDDLYVDDNSGNCHRIEDKKQFLDLLVKSYNNANKIKLEEQQKLKSARTTAKIVGL